jgi:TP901 family phage tail tape measure protein
MLLGGSSSRGDINLGIRFYLKDQFSGPVRAMRQNVKGLEHEFRAFQDSLRVGRNMSAGITAFGVAATRALFQATMEGAEFLYIMRGVEAITEATTEQMERLSNLAIKIGKESIFMPEEIASGMRFMAMAGQSAPVIEKTVEAFTNLGAATMTPLGGKMGAADIGTNALKAFGWQAERSAEMSDILVAATTNANVSLNDLGNSIRYVAATSRNLEIPVQETIGLLMSLGNAGIQSSMAGTALENMYRYMARSLTGNASKKAKEAWESLGLGRQDVTDIKGNFLPIVDILGKMNKAMVDMDPIQVQAIFRNIFGVRGLRAAATLAKNLDEVGKFTRMLNDESKIGGTAKTKADIMLDSLHGSSLKLMSAWKGLKAQFAKSIAPMLSRVFLGLKWVVDKLSDLFASPIGSWIAGLTSLVLMGTTAFFGLKTVIFGVAYAMKSMTMSVGSFSSALRIWGGFMGIPGGFNMARGAQMYRTQAMASNWKTPTHSPSGATSPLWLPYHYRDPKTGRFRAVPKPRVNVSPLTLGMQGPTSTLKATRTVGTLGRLAGIGGRLLGFLAGPWGIALQVGLTALPFAISALTSAVSRNSESLEKNTIALTPDNTPLSAETYAFIEGKRVGDLIEMLLENAYEARYNGLVTNELLQEVVNNGDLNAVIGLFGSPEGMKFSLDTEQKKDGN